MFKIFAFFKVIFKAKHVLYKVFRKSCKICILGNFAINLNIAQLKGEAKLFMQTYFGQLTIVLNFSSVRRLVAFLKDFMFLKKT